MSNVFYPISLISRLVPIKVDAALADAFDNGTVNTRRKWPAQFFKRQFQILHDNLTAAEFRYLKSFHSQRSGQYDSFWFRDNVNRDGNLLCRFAGPLQYPFSGSTRQVQVTLEEVAPIRALPEWDEITAAAGATPLLWLDPNREIYYQHAGTTYAGETAPKLFDPLPSNYVTNWQAGSTLLNLGGLTGQNQYYAFNGTAWAKTSANITPITGSKPAVSIFVLARNKTVTANQVVFALGGTGNNTAFGLGLVSSDNSYRPFLGGTTFSSAPTGFTNNPDDIWQSFAVCSQTITGSDFITMYRNGVAAHQISNPLTTYAVGPAALGAAPDGTLISNPSNAVTDAHVGHVLVFNTQMTLAQAKALHNLLAVPYGCAAV